MTVKIVHLSSVVVMSIDVWCETVIYVTRIGVLSFSGYSQSKPSLSTSSAWNFMLHCQKLAWWTCYDIHYAHICYGKRFVIALVRDQIKIIVLGVFKNGILWTWECYRGFCQSCRPRSSANDTTKPSGLWGKRANLFWKGHYLVADTCVSLKAW